MLCFIFKYLLLFTILIFKRTINNIRNYEPFIEKYCKYLIIYEKKVKITNWYLSNCKIFQTIGMVTHVGIYAIHLLISNYY